MTSISLMLCLVTLRADAGQPAGTGDLSPSVKQLVARVQAFYEKTRDFRADFEQTYTYKLMRRTTKSSGQVTFKKPAMMRWEYLKPSSRTFVLAGERAYSFDPEAKLLTRAPFASNQLSASVTFLWGRGQLADEFFIEEKKCASCQGRLLEMTPKKPDARFQRIVLEIDSKSAQVLQSTVIDPDGSENAIRFLNLVTNADLPDSHFKLSPPAGTQIQDFLQATDPLDAGK